MEPLLHKERKSISWRHIVVSFVSLLFLIIALIFITSSHRHDTPLSTNTFIKEEKEEIEEDTDLPFETLDRPYYSENGEDDLVESLFGVDYNSCSDSPTNCGFSVYSGYLLATNDHEIHYWFLEADTVDDPMTKPLFFWTNGGPGCSGAYGLFTEQGPYRVLQNLSLIYNPYTWIREVNMVFLEQPYGVGFSVVDPSLHPVAGDLNAAEDMDAMIRNFLIKFPRYSEHPVYISSESWGGHYVPMTSWQILVNNDQGHLPYVNFKGFFLGNPYTNEYENKYGHLDTLYGHGLWREDEYAEWRKYCWNNGTAIWNNFTHSGRTLCSKLYYSAYWAAKEVDTYALDWPQCIISDDWSIAGPGHNGSHFNDDDNNNNNNDNDYDNEWILNLVEDHHSLNGHRYSEYSKYRTLMDAPIHWKTIEIIEEILDHPDYESLGLQPTRKETVDLYETLVNGESVQSSKWKKSQKGFGVKSEGKLSADYSLDTDSYIPCAEYYLIDYLQQYQVQRAFNVKPINWTICSAQVSDDWEGHDVHRFMEYYYTDIFKKYSMKYNITMAIYSGDDDTVCSTAGTQYWLDQWEGFTADDKVDWIPWKDRGNELGGFYTIFHNNDNMDYNALHFFTIRTAGHMVPTFEPGRSLTVLRKFLYEIKNWKVETGEDGL